MSEELDGDGPEHREMIQEMETSKPTPVGQPMLDFRIQGIEASLELARQYKVIHPTKAVEVIAELLAEVKRLRGDAKGGVSEDMARIFYEKVAPTGQGTSGLAWMLASASSGSHDAAGKWKAAVQPWSLWKNHSGGYFATELRKALYAALKPTIGLENAARRALAVLKDYISIDKDVSKAAGMKLDNIVNELDLVLNPSD